MAEVLEAFAGVLSFSDLEKEDELHLLADIATETFTLEPFKAEESDSMKTQEDIDETDEQDERFEAEIVYRAGSTKFFFVISALLTLLLITVQGDSGLTESWRIYTIIPAIFLESFFQKKRVFHIGFGGILIAYMALLTYPDHMPLPYIVFILCILISRPDLTLAGAVASAIWFVSAFTEKPAFIYQTAYSNIGWIPFAILILVLQRYYLWQIRMEKSTAIRESIFTHLYDKIPIVMIAGGIILWIIQKVAPIAISEVITGLHFIPAGIVSLIGFRLLRKYEESPQNFLQSFKHKEGMLTDDEFLG